jgi:hypothetical protein
MLSEWAIGLLGPVFWISLVCLLLLTEIGR